MLPPSTFVEMTVDDVMVAVSWLELRKVSFDNEVMSPAPPSARRKLGDILRRLR
jgi:hypothetical protein